MLEDQLLLVIRLQNHRVFVKTLDAAGKLHAAHQVDGEEGLLFARVV